jgi:hypothetical protein
MNSHRIVSLFVSCALVPALRAQVSPPVAAFSSAIAGLKRIEAREIDAHLRFLSSDLLEGRAPATRRFVVAAPSRLTSLTVSKS